MSRAEDSPPERFSIGQFVERACRLEADTPKPGNVHPGASFADTTHEDFVESAAAIRPVFDQAPTESIGTTVLEAVTATRQRVGKNTNLGIILLLAPLARLGRGYRVTTHAERERLRTAIHDILHATTRSDAELVYEAIRRAVPGGLGKVDYADIRSRPEGTLLEMMALARDRDLIARQYTDSYREVVHEGLPHLSRVVDSGGSLEDAIVTCFLGFLSRHGDSLIRRKCGAKLSSGAARRASEVLEKGGPRSEDGAAALNALDRWLRDDGNRRNPGSSADLTVAVLFLAMRGGIIRVRSRPRDFGEDSSTG